MSVELNHTIVHAQDNRESAEFLAHILGLEVGTEWGPFIPVATGNGVTLDFATIPAESIVMQHYAFLMPDARTLPWRRRRSTRRELPPVNDPDWPRQPDTPARQAL
jgi:catechol-2,3-dioxygenase